MTTTTATASPADLRALADALATAAHEARGMAIGARTLGLRSAAAYARRADKAERDAQRAERAAVAA